MGETKQLAGLARISAGLWPTGQDWKLVEEYLRGQGTPEEIRARVRRLDLERSIKKGS